LIADGALDREEANVAKLSERLGLGERQLRRLFLQHLGASPIVVAQTRRVLFAKQLIHETRMPMTEVALAAGFGSIRRFNEVFQDLFHRPPSDQHSADAIISTVLFPSYFSLNFVALPRPSRPNDGLTLHNR